MGPEYLTEPGRGFGQAFPFNWERKTVRASEGAIWNLRQGRNTTTETWTEAKRNSYGSDMPSGEIASNWAITVAEREGINGALESVLEGKEVISRRTGQEESLAIIPEPHESSVREVSMPKPRTVEKALDSLERKGLVQRSGFFRTAPNGEVQPLWALTPLAKWLSETAQFDNYLATWKTDLKSS